MGGGWKLPWNTRETPNEHPDEHEESTSQPTTAPADAPMVARVAQLEAELASLRLEWAEVLDKINRWASRQAARERQRAVRQLDALGEEAHEDPPETTISNGAGVDGGGRIEDRATAKAALRARANQLFRRG